jgi:hypothetical protein
MKLSFRHPAYYKWGVTEVPADWTAAQWESLQEVCTIRGVKLVLSEWTLRYGGYLMNTKPIYGMFIGIEKDGYAHTSAATDVLGLRS